MNVVAVLLLIIHGHITDVTVVGQTASMAACIRMGDQALHNLPTPKEGKYALSCHDYSNVAEKAEHPSADSPPGTQQL